MPPIAPDSDFIGTSCWLHLSDAERELSLMALTEQDLDSLRINDADLADMALSVEDILTMTDEDWAGLRLSPNVLMLLRDDLMKHFGVRAHDLTWLCRTIERGKHGHTRAQTGTH